MSEGRLIALAAGGTGGHIFPAQALAEEMRRRGWRIMLFTDDRGMRYAERIEPDVTQRLDAGNPNVAGLLAKLKAGFGLLGGVMTARAAIAREKPSVVVGFGGYPSAPAMLAARLTGTPYGVHEQNAVLGRANRLVVPKANFVAHAFERLDALPANRKGALHLTGNPVRDAVVAVKGAPYSPPTDEDAINLFVFGGSQGAAILSRTVPEAVAQLPEALRARLRVVQQVREDEVETVEAAYAEAGVAATVATFFQDMPDRLSAAQLVICRAGASSVTELAMVGRPSILVPLAIAMDDHQTGNARSLSDRDAAIILSESVFTPDRLATELGALLTSPGRLAQMAARAAEAAPGDAAARLADIVESLV